MAAGAAPAPDLRRGRRRRLRPRRARLRSLRRGRPRPSCCSAGRRATPRRWRRRRWRWRCCGPRRTRSPASGRRCSTPLRSRSGGGLAGAPAAFRPRLPASTARGALSTRAGRPHDAAAASPRCSRRSRRASGIGAAGVTSPSATRWCSPSSCRAAPGVPCWPRSAERGRAPPRRAGEDAFRGVEGRHAADRRRHRAARLRSRRSSAAEPCSRALGQALPSWHVALYQPAGGIAARHGRRQARSSWRPSRSCSS